METIRVDGLEGLFSVLRDRGFTVVGPTVQDRAIVYDELSSSGDLPIGWTDRQDGGVYRLERRDDEARFGYAVGPHSWKKYLLPPVIELWRASRNGDGFQIEGSAEEPPKYAFIGVRSCELHAIAVQDRVFLQGSHVDPVYQARRDGIFVVAVNCGQAGGTCFCVSMNTGPKAAFGYDLALTEILSAEGHYFTVDVGTEAGASVIQDLAHQDATPDEEAAARRVVENTAANMGRQMDTTDIKDLLYQNLEHPQWDDVASRCLTCANCTMVCPTCFCTTVTDSTDLSGDSASRHRRWDSCFNLDFSSLSGGSVRNTPKSRYRQWMTHKLATWFDQFGSSGCVGCGRCITWCPVAIDITQEVAAIRKGPNSPDSGAG